MSDDFREFYDVIRGEFRDQGQSLKGKTKILKEAAELAGKYILKAARGDEEAGDLLDQLEGVYDLVMVGVKAEARARINRVWETTLSFGVKVAEKALDIAL